MGNHWATFGRTESKNPEPHAAIRLWRGGKSESPIALTGVATLEDSHFFSLSGPGQCWPRNSFSTPRKDARGVRFRYLFREVLKVLNQMRHKAAQTHFLPCIFFFRGAFLFSTRPTPDLAPEESKKEKSMLHSLIFYAPSPPSPKESRSGWKGTFVEEKVYL